MPEHAFERFSPSWGYARKAAEHFWTQVEAGERPGTDFRAVRARLADALPDADRAIFVSTFTDELLRIGETAYPPPVVSSSPNPEYVRMAAVRLLSQRAMRASSPRVDEELKQEARRLAEDLPREQRPAFYLMLDERLKVHPAIPRMAPPGGWYAAPEPYVLIAAGVAVAIVAAFLFGL